ncbi:MAG: HAMP domain-containing sensor histidine kinase [Elusimicrobia bacterium]|nr:HAMP domain-containing sensor histidine kinase [Elusimicrobiota bacterium]
MVVIVMLSGVLTPFYHDRLVRDARMEAQGRASDLISNLLQSNYQGARRIIDDRQFLAMAGRKMLYPYSLDDYPKYGLPYSCPGKMQRIADLDVCVAGANLEIEIPLSSADNLLGHLILRVPASIYSWTPFRRIVGVLIIAIVLVLAAGYSLQRYFETKVAIPIRAIVAKILSTKNPDEIRGHINNLALEELQLLSNAVVDRAQELKRLQFSKELAELSAQVAHDIRSPLAALDAVAKDLSQLPEDKRTILRSAAGRIRDIANHLIDKYHDAAGSADASGSPEPVSVELLSSHIDPLVTEKRMQFRSRIGVEIECPQDSAAYGLFARIQPAEFKRVLSNLVNNGVEALAGDGTVTISLAPEEGRVCLRVRDNGQGMPPEILARIGARGGTYGKAGGSGLGLYHARANVESWGGGLDISSQVGTGTTVTIKLPLAQPPEWFVPRIELAAGGVVVILDDDTSIHRIWQGRFDSRKVNEHGIEVLHFSTPDDMRGFVRGNRDQAVRALYLVDYELLGHGVTGLDVVEELSLGGRSILVTSRFEEKDILAECRRLKVRMIPKGLAGFVPISVAASELAVTRGTGPDAVLLDDDALVRMTWKAAAKSKGIDLAAFPAPRDLLAAIETFPKGTAIYLDSKLGDGVKGEDVAKELHAKGFTNLYLATGYDRDSLPAMPWIREVVGKEPPWA